MWKTLPYNCGTVPVHRSAHSYILISSFIFFGIPGIAQPASDYMVSYRIQHESVNSAYNREARWQHLRRRGSRAVPPLVRAGLALARSDTHSTLENSTGTGTADEGNSRAQEQQGTFPDAGGVASFGGDFSQQAKYDEHDPRGQVRSGRRLRFFYSGRTPTLTRTTSLPGGLSFVV